MTYGKRGSLVRLLYLFVAILFLLVKRLLRIYKHGKIVLCYHGVKDSQKNKFIKQLHIIKKKISVINGNTISGKTHPKHFTVCLTFDDAFENLITNVIPHITEFQIPITIFIPTGSIGDQPFWLKKIEHPDSFEKVMSVCQIESLQKNSMVSFGSHTVDHPRLSRLSGKQIREQLRGSRAIISKLVGERITELALPHGDYNQKVIKISCEEGYNKIYTLDPKVFYEDGNIVDPLIGRFSVSPDDWAVEFYLTINGAYSWLYEWRLIIQYFRNYFLK
jgi:peptidoglycan/xylan/chitin deacetylase (PgdA/CDA1 family)